MGLVMNIPKNDKKKKMFLNVSEIITYGTSNALVFSLNP